MLNSLNGVLPILTETAKSRCTSLFPSVHILYFMSLFVNYFLKFSSTLSQTPPVPSLHTQNTSPPTRHFESIGAFSLCAGVVCRGLKSLSLALSSAPIFHGLFPAALLLFQSFQNNPSYGNFLLSNICELPRLRARP